MGFIVLGHKHHYHTYSKEDLDLLENISRELASALVNSKLHQDATQLTEVLQSEVQRAVQAWKQKSKENEQLANVQSQFIDIVSHQLRTPISVTRNTLQFILADYYHDTKNPEGVLSEHDRASVIKLLRNAFLASENLRNTTENILAASELVVSMPNLRITQITTRDFFRTRVERTRELLTSRPTHTITLQVILSEDLPVTFSSDETKLGMVLDNLLMNAALYTISGSITLRVYPENHHFTIEVQDTGIGIPEAEQHRIFQRFVRLRNAQLVVPNGSGLGLYLSREYIRLLRGSIHFTSQVNQGTTFTITLPREYEYVI
jgi:signal transduction histidine kinase